MGVCDIISIEIILFGIKEFMEYSVVHIIFMTYHKHTIFLSTTVTDFHFTTYDSHIYM